MIKRGSILKHGFGMILKLSHKNTLAAFQSLQEAARVYRENGPPRT